MSMLRLALASLLFGASLSAAFPIFPRAVTLNPAAVAEAHKRDNTATRAFSNIQIKTSDGKCLFIDPLSGDFRQNLIPIQTATCDGSANQMFDVITKGKHNNRPGNAIIVSSLTNGCLDFDDRQNRVILFSCGGRGDGSGDTSASQLFSFKGGAGPLPLAPQNKNDICLAANTQANKLEKSTCNPATASGNQLFTFGNVGKQPPTIVQQAGSNDGCKTK